MLGLSIKPDDKPALHSPRNQGPPVPGAEQQPLFHASKSREGRKLGGKRPTIALQRMEPKPVDSGTFRLVTAEWIKPLRQWSVSGGAVHAHSDQGGKSSC